MSSPLSSIPLVTKTGAKAEVNALAGKVVALYFSAHWCPPCKAWPGGWAPAVAARSARIRPFSEPLIVSVCGLPRPLLVVSGACVAMDLQLEMDQIAFGQVILGGAVTRRIMLQNLGDMPSNFSVQGGFAPDFSVSPREGFLQPNEDVNLEVTFHPSALSRDIRYVGAVTCDGQPPLPLTLTGMCVDATAEPTTLSFKTRVREPSAQIGRAHV